jgi:ADP-dependent NAD(P)H-hydrate dehydratase / NAD(P)H-hydrate epimerase
MGNCTKNSLTLAAKVSDLALLSTSDMARVDTLTAKDWRDGTFELMMTAAHALLDVVLAHHSAARRIAILCGPGNNGGDGMVLAALLRERGVTADVFAHGAPMAGSDAAKAAALWRGGTQTLGAFDPSGFDLVIDALFGAGLSRPPEGEVAAAIGRLNAAGCAIVAVDVPSGVSGDTGLVTGAAVNATRTVTFFRKKPGHVLQPGARLCGVLHVAGIGISGRVLGAIPPGMFENGPALWRHHLPLHEPAVHKYSRGAVAVVSGGATHTGAARLAAAATMRAGAGAATILSPSDALGVHAAHLTAIMLERCDNGADLESFLATGKTSAIIIGPGGGVDGRMEALLGTLLAQTGEPAGERRLKGLVMDADAISVMARSPADWLARLKDNGIASVLTPHEGEFARLFPDLGAGSKIERARDAARRSQAIVLLKGPDTVIAAPDDRVVINTNSTLALATAGSGDVLAGIIAALLAQGMPAFEAACAAAWLHGEAGRIAGPWQPAEALSSAICDAMRRLFTEES